jgi:hypothetical protein
MSKPIVASTVLRGNGRDLPETLKTLAILHHDGLIDYSAAMLGVYQVHFFPGEAAYDALAFMAGGAPRCGDCSSRTIVLEIRPLTVR